MTRDSLIVAAVLALLLALLASVIIGASLWLAASRGELLVLQWGGER